MDAASWEKVKDLIADALELPSSEREAFLAAHCSDEALLREARSLLQGHDEAPDFLEHPPQLDDLDDNADDLEPGSQVGPYVVVDRLGRGGMGQVFLGNDRRLQRKVALKRLFPTREGPSDERSRIFREARAAARINHPNVATIHDVVEHDDRIFIVMEYVEGESLAARLRHKTLPIDRIVSIGRQLASALVAAHANGVVHRDLKPANVQLTPDGLVKVLDFGVAKAGVPLSSPSGAPTTARSVRLVGTPAYMSPEQLRGLDVDERSDLYSLGVVLFEMVTGQRLHGDADQLDRSTTLVHVAPRVDETNPHVPRGLADIIAKALEVDVSERFQSAAEMESALEAVMGEMASRRPAGLAGVVDAALHRRAWRVTMAVALSPIVLAALGMVNTAAFNHTLDRPARFASEPLLMYVAWGYRSNVMLLLTALLAAMVVAACQFFVRILSLFGPVERLLARARRNVDVLVVKLRLNDPIVLAQCVAMTGVVALTLIIWWHHRLIAAYMGFINVATPDQLLPLAPENFRERRLYRILVNVLLLTCGLGLFRVVQLRREQRTRRGLGAVAITVAVLGLVLLMHAFPYRILFHNAAEKITFAGNRCYVLGEDATELLIYCPETPPPHNRVVQRDDPAVQRLGVTESIFTPSIAAGSVSP